MHKVNFPTVVFDPYEFLPPHGESAITSKFENNALNLRVTYDDEERNKEQSFELIFRNAIFHKIESFPGVDGMKYNYEYGNEISSLLEFGFSDLKNAWEEHFKGVFKFSHFKIFFLNANKSVEIICESYSLKTIT